MSNSEVRPNATELLNQVATVPAEMIPLDAVELQPRNLRCNGHGHPIIDVPLAPVRLTRVARPKWNGQIAKRNGESAAEILNSFARMESPGVDLQPDDLWNAAKEFAAEESMQSSSESLRTLAKFINLGLARRAGCEPKTHAELGL